MVLCGDSVGKRDSFRDLRKFYETQLFDDILSFWMKHGIDSERGGYFNGFNNTGDRLLHRHKLTWSQGRFLWMLSRLYRQFKGKRPDAETDAYLEHASHGARFLMDHALLTNGFCAFALTERGGPIVLDPDGTAREACKGESYDTSVYSDLFVVYGLSEYARVSGDTAAYTFAFDLFDRARERFFRPTYPSAPYPVPEGYEPHGRMMILLDTAHELAQTARHFGDERAGGLLSRAEEWMGIILDRYRLPDRNLIVEFYSDDPARRETILGTYVNPGHMLESMWFVCHLARELDRTDRVEQALSVARAACDTGWDEEFGGFCQYVHLDGGPPRGAVPPELRNEVMIRLLRENWSNKLWWPHSEAMYMLLLGYELSGDEGFLERYRRVHDYTFGTFPNPDRAVREWIQIRERDGTPVDKVVALPVKDPFHITRAFMHIIATLEQLGRAADGKPSCDCA